MSKEEITKEMKEINRLDMMIQSGDPEMQDLACQLCQAMYTHLYQVSVGPWTKADVTSVLANRSFRLGLEMARIL